MLKRLILVSGMLVLLSSYVQAQSQLEVPQPNSTPSGIGLVSGWKCTAGTITVQFDNSGPFYTAAYGTIREDTLGICGDTNNGWALLWNWNRLGDGPHTVTVFDNGQPFSSAEITVQTLGQEFRQGLNKTVSVPDFPEVGQTTTLVWDQAQQNFVINDVTEGGPTSGICTTKSTTVADPSSRGATFILTNPCQDNQLQIQVGANANNNGGFFVCEIEISILQNGASFTSANFSVMDETGSTLCLNLIPGSSVSATLTPSSGVPLDFSQPFAFYYNDVKLFDFP